MEVVNALGRRKRAIARVFVSEGTGKITINKRDLAEYFPSTILQYVVKQPLNKLGAAAVSYTHLPDPFQIGRFEFGFLLGRRTCYR